MDIYSVLHRFQNNKLTFEEYIKSLEEINFHFALHVFFSEVKVYNKENRMFYRNHCTIRYGQENILKHILNYHFNYMVHRNFTNTLEYIIDNGLIVYEQ
jgi:hypothetical protein